MAIVVITGCSSGIGYDSALAFACRGDRVYACVRNPERAASLAQKYHGCTFRSDYTGVRRCH
ncbi:MAG: SDR family NAD(P)-dependent oxidoreductase [bacterium]|nr:SDR family NAD(P)-dependent oxidoreductase [Gammaproteobacteria bacterium]HIL84451.1 SDR family NAD(P)-dependent oxidoreductase [Pseudomonadales bacterium]